MNAIGAVDIGGTKTAVGIVDDSGRVLTRAEAPTQTIGPWPEALALISKMLRTAARVANLTISGIGVGSTGPLDPPGCIVANVPYGERLAAGSRKQLKSFYHSLGEALGGLRGHRLALLSASEDFESAFGLRPRSRAVLWNGPLRSTLYGYLR